MMTFQSSTDLSRLQLTDPAQPVVTKLARGLFTETQPVTVALMEPDDDHPLTELCNAEDVTLEGVIERENMFMIALQTKYLFSIVLVVPKIIGDRPRLIDLKWPSRLKRSNSPF